MANERRLTTGDIMRHCHVSRSTVLRWVKSGKLSAYLHPDGQCRITQAAFMDFLTTHNMPIDGELLRAASDRGEGTGGTEVKRHGRK